MRYNAKGRSFNALTRMIGVGQIPQLAGLGRLVRMPDSSRSGKIGKTRTVQQILVSIRGARDMMSCAVDDE
jgi:hypothetical protein